MVNQIWRPVPYHLWISNLIVLEPEIIFFTILRITLYHDSKDTRDTSKAIAVQVCPLLRQSYPVFSSKEQLDPVLTLHFVRVRNKST